MTSKFSGRRGYRLLKAGLATSLLFLCFGFAAAFCWAMIVPKRTVYLSSFAAVWLVVACLAGGLVAGVLGRSGAWRRAGVLGMAVGIPVLVWLWGISPGSPKVREIASCLVALPLISSLGALLGANLAVRRGAERRAYRSPD